MSSDSHVCPRITHGFSGLTDEPCKLLKVISQIQGRVEICIRESKDAFITREREDPKMLQYPKPTDANYAGKVLSHNYTRPCDLNWWPVTNVLPKFNPN